MADRCPWCGLPVVPSLNAHIQLTSACLDAQIAKFLGGSDSEQAEK